MGDPEADSDNPVLKEEQEAQVCSWESWILSCVFATSVVICLQFDLSVLVFSYIKY